MQKHVTFVKKSMLKMKVIEKLQITKLVQFQ